jgi:hypothetical protein
MRLLPPPGPERRRTFFLIALLAIVGAYAYYNYFRADTVSSPPTTTTRASSNPTDAILKTTAQAKPGTRGALAGATDNQMPQALRLPELENRVPDEPEAGRNLFRFGVKPAPPPPPPQPQAPVVVGPPPPPPGPPPIPPIPLKYFSFYTTQDGKNVAWLVDKTNAVFQAVEGDTVDGRYKLLKVTPKFVEMEYVPGTYPQGNGRRTIMLNGGG